MKVSTLSALKKAVVVPTLVCNYCLNGDCEKNKKKTK